MTGDAQANFPATAGAFSTTFLSLDAEIFVTKLNATGTGLVYSTAIPGAHPATVMLVRPSRLMRLGTPT